MRAWAATLVIAAAPGCSCGDGASAADAAVGGDGGAIEDAAVHADAALPLIWIDFSVVGCDVGATALAGGDAGPDEADAGRPFEPCRGAAPLRLSFTPIAPAPVDRHEWSFGDGGEPDRRASPDHVYTLPGTYDVSLFGQGPGGTAAVTKPGLVEVRPGAIGNPCADDAQCASGSCLCGAEACAGIATGFCSAACSAAEPCAEGVCADLAPAAPPDPAAWQARLCLADCAAGCAGGQVCRELRRGDGDGWTLACFAPGLLGDIGDSCADAGGQRQDELCTSGLCAAEGLRGACIAGCAADPCPPSAACATFNGGGAPSCLARCDADTACAGDPWLACEAPGGPGAKGFIVDEKPSRDGYCAPEACEAPEECPQGQCANGFCGP
jgi:PKD repeat protein